MTIPQQPISITTEAIHDLSHYWQNNLIPNGWNCLFTLPPWLKAWHSAFAESATSEFTVFRNGSQIIGAVPLLIDGREATIFGSPDVCDYTSLIISPGYEKAILLSLFNYLSLKNINVFIANGIREDAPFYSILSDIAETTCCKCTTKQLDLSFEKKLPSTWQSYLNDLNGKQRHEIRRKIRRIKESGDIDLRIVENPKDVVNSYEDFFRLFVASGEDKAKFMDHTMNTFFTALLENMARAGLLRLYFLDIDRTPAATALCFEFNNTMFLYNSGYDPQFHSLSVGLTCKTLSIQNAIERGCTTYDFLKGKEPYKHRLGGSPVPVYQVKFYLR